MKVDMNIPRATTALFLLAALGTASHAESEKTREQVKAGLAEVVRNRDVLGTRDTARSTPLGQRDTRALGESWNKTSLGPVEQG
jgi:DNA invertase Pin-like site-specific DNA recombinase